MMAVGLLAVVVQVLVAFTAALAAPTERGRAVGLVTSGVITGILAARFASGVLADLGGWRADYLCSAAIMLVLSALLARIMPKREPPARDEELPRCIEVGARAFPSRTTPAQPGYSRAADFRIFQHALDIDGAAAERPTAFAHAYGDRPLRVRGARRSVGGHWRWQTRRSGFWAIDDGNGARSAHSLMDTDQFPATFSCPSSPPASVLLDLAVQAVHVTNQSLIFAAYPDAQSRLVGGYMVLLFYRQCGRRHCVHTASTRYSAGLEFLY